MTDVYVTYLDVLDQVNKEENGYLPVDLFNRLLQVASRFVFNEYQARLQSAEAAVREKQKLLDRLFPFIQMQELAVENGYAELPEDYAYFSSAKTFYDNGDSLVQLNALYSKQCLAEDDPTINLAEIQDEIDKVINNPKLAVVQLLDNEQVGRRLRSYVPGKRPSAKKPICEREGGRFHLYPEDPASLFLWYYRRPALAKLVMTPTATFELQYDQASSVQLEWGSEAMNDITTKVSNDFAIYIRENGLWQMTQTEKQKNV